MKIIDNLIRVPLNESESLFINTLSGAVDIVDEPTDRLLREWTKNGIPKNQEQHQELIQVMNDRQYILTSEEESSLKAILCEKLKANTLKKQQEPDFLSFIITYDCNFRCPYCYQKNIAEKGEEWSRKTISKVMIDQAFELHYETVKMVHLFGGEPLLIDNIEIVEYILNKKKDIKFSITTNGYYLQEFIPLLKKYDINVIEVTLDGFLKTHNRTRFLASNEGTFDKIMLGIKAALDSDMKIKIRMNVSHENLEESNSLSKWLHEHFNTSNLSVFRNAIFGDSKVCRHEIFSKMIRQEHEGGHMLNSTIDTLHPIINLIKGNGKWYPKYVFCKAHEGHRFFDPHGNFYTCFLAVGDTNKRAGKYFPELKIENNWMERNVESLEKCSKCNKAFFCGGGCANAAMGSGKDVMKAHCQPTNDILYRILPLAYELYMKDRDSDVK